MHVRVRVQELSAALQDMHDSAVQDFELDERADAPHPAAMLNRVVKRMLSSLEGDREQDLDGFVEGLFTGASAELLPKLHNTQQRDTAGLQNLFGSSNGRNADASFEQGGAGESSVHRGASDEARAGSASAPLVGPSQPDTSGSARSDAFFFLGRVKEKG